MRSVALVLPYQLFADNPAVKAQQHGVWLVEEGLLFNDSAYPIKMHQQKLQLHFASLAYYRDTLQQQGIAVSTIAHQGDGLEIARAMQQIAQSGAHTVHLLDPVDDWIMQRLQQQANIHQLQISWHKSPGFFNTSRLNQQYRQGKKRWFMADFYKFQRQRLNILMEGDQPMGGQWSYDADNRKKVPKAKLASIPRLQLADTTPYHQQAISRIQQDYADHPGDGQHIIYPVTHAQAQQWLSAFLQQRFDQFGPYEDAIVAEQHWLWHSVLTPMLNIGLLTPEQVISQTLEYAKQHDIAINSVEGFVRQIIGWREFIRATYHHSGSSMRCSNHWQHRRKIPAEFYRAQTRIKPLDDVISKILDTGYCHHIERLMVLGGFFFLCEFDPDDIYHWFMQMFVDSYDWVMVPNVYAMSQHADGGQITTKPYFCGSNYILKMSHYAKGEWSEIWDGLYWRWIFKHQAALAQNPRWAMMCRQADKMDQHKKQQHLQIAEQYLSWLDSCG